MQGSWFACLIAYRKTCRSASGQSIRWWSATGEGRKPLDADTGASELPAMAAQAPP